MESSTVEGVIVPIISPIRENEEVDEKGFRLLIRHCIENGLQGIFVAGSNGESLSLTQKQRNQIIQLALEETAGVIPVLCGVMDTSTKRVIENIRWVESCGGEYIVITPVFYARHACPQEQIRHFSLIAESTQLKIFLYNIPRFTGVNITPQIVEMLRSFPNIVGIKESSGDFAQFLDYLSYKDENRFVVFQGITEQAGPSLLWGADGYNPVLAPVFPELFLSLYHQAKKRNVEKVVALTKLVRKSSSILKMTTNATSAAKFAISYLGYTRKNAFLPTEPIKEHEEKQIIHAIEEVKNDFSRLQAGL